MQRFKIRSDLPFRRVFLAMVGMEGGRDLEAERPAGVGGAGPGSAGGRGVTGRKDAGVSGLGGCTL